MIRAAPLLALCALGCLSPDAREAIAPLGAKVDELAGIVSQIEGIDPQTRAALALVAENRVGERTTAAVVALSEQLDASTETEPASSSSAISKPEALGIGGVVLTAFGIAARMWASRERERGRAEPQPGAPA